MKRIIAGVLAGLMLLLSGCGAEKNELTSEFQPDFTVSFYHEGSMIATEDGYFVVDERYAYTFFVDRETLDSTIFCADPTCDHRFDKDLSVNLDCMSMRVYTALGAIQYYNGEIYFKATPHNSVKTSRISQRHLTE